MEKTKKVPDIRFKGFSDEWETTNINSVSKVYDGTHQTPKYKETGIMFLSVEDIKTLKSNKFISQEDFLIDFKIYPERGDILMTRIGDIGTSNVVETDEMMAYYVSLALIKPFDISPYYLNYLTGSNLFQKEIDNRSLTTAIPKKINMGEIGKVTIYKPVAEEQTQIGEFFKNLDEKLELEKAKHEKLLIFKKAMLDDMFPKEGEKVPKIRFEGFTDEWEDISLSDICDVSNGSMDTQDADINGKYPFFIRSEEVMRSNKFLYDEEAILTPGEGKIGEIFHYIKGKYTAHQRVYRLFNFGKSINSTFLIYVLKNSFKNHALKNSSTATAPSIRKGTLTDFRFMVGSPEEQALIGNFFKNLDDKIELSEMRIEKIENFKQAMREKMFV